LEISLVLQNNVRMIFSAKSEMEPPGSFCKSGKLPYRGVLLHQNCRKLLLQSQMRIECDGPQDIHIVSEAQRPPKC